MSIVTKTGDKGETSLFYGKRVSKTHSLVEVCGQLDELNAALGLVNVHKPRFEIQQWVDWIQEHLIPLMGIFATDSKDIERYLTEAQACFKTEDLLEIEGAIKKMESQLKPMKGWAIPGRNSTPIAAYLDLSRTVCRRAERQISHYLEGEKQKHHLQILAAVFVNRLSDFLWVLARYENVLNEEENNS